MALGSNRHHVQMVPTTLAKEQQEYLIACHALVECTAKNLDWQFPLVYVMKGITVKVEISTQIHHKQTAIKVGLVISAGKVTSALSEVHVQWNANQAHFRIKLGRPLVIPAPMVTSALQKLQV